MHSDPTPGFGTPRGIRFDSLACRLELGREQGQRIVGFVAEGFWLVVGLVSCGDGVGGL